MVDISIASDSPRIGLSGTTPASVSAAQGTPWSSAPMERALKWLLFLVVHLIGAALFVFSTAPGDRSALWHFPLDDAWIHLVYARSFADLAPMEYNPGQPETGASSLLWPVLLSPVVALTRSSPWATVVGVKLVGVLCATACSSTYARLATSLTGRAWLGIVVGLMIAIDPWLGFSRVSGMEVHLAAACTGWMFAELAEERPTPAGIAMGLAILARPENVVLVVVGLLVLAKLLAKPGTTALTRVWSAALVPVSLGIWAISCWAISGRLLPNTYYAKSKVTSDQVADNVGALLGPALAELSWSSFFLGPLFWILGSVILLRRRVEAAPSIEATEGSSIARDAHLRLVAIAVMAAPWLFLLGVAQSRVISQWGSYYWHRWLEPALPPTLLVIGVGAFFATQWAFGLRPTNAAAPPTRTRAKWQTALLASAQVLALFGLLYRLGPDLKSRIELYAWNCRNIAEVQVALGVWAREHVNEDEWIAISDAGAQRWFSERRSLDLFGLNDHRVIADGNPASRVDSLDVRVFIVFPSQFPWMTESSDLVLVHEERSEHYTICDCEQDVMRVYVRDVPGRTSPLSDGAPVRSLRITPQSSSR